MALPDREPMEAADLLVVGAGLGGLQLAAKALRDGTSGVLLVERAPRVGGSVRTQRSEGFVCELGRPYLPQGEFEALAACLAAPPRAVPLAEAARSGQVLRAGSLEPAEVTEPLVSCRGGLEDLLVAFHRELAPHLRLGREVTALEPTGDGLVAHLGGEQAAPVRARRAALALPLAECARLLAPADARVGIARERTLQVAVARVHLGWWTSELAQVPAGHGIAVEDGAGEGVREVLWCSNQFSGRSIPGRFLARIEVAGELAQQDDAALEATVRGFLAARGGIERQPVFRRVHRTTEPRRNSALAELAVRVREAAARWGCIEWVD